MYLKPYIRRYISWPIETVLAVTLFGLFKLLPVQIASRVGGGIAGMLGPLVRPAHRVGWDNLSAAFPETPTAQKARWLRAAWANLGRLFAELAHINEVVETRVHIDGRENVDAARKLDCPILAITGHIGNWEVAPFVLSQLGLDLRVFARPLNNPYMHRLLDHIRRKSHAHIMYKGASGTRDLIRAFQNGYSVGMLPDQRLSSGAAIPFMGRDARTTLTPARLALHYNAVILPVHVRRYPNATFHVVIDPPYVPHGTPEEVMTRMNANIAGWISQDPSQWLWFHKRWK